MTTKREKSANDVVIVSGVRTPFGRFGGILKDVPAIDLGVAAMKGALDRAGNKDIRVDEVIVGNCCQCEVKPLAPVVARAALLKAGLPEDTVSITLDRACCSSMAAVQAGQRDIITENANVVLAAGMENMSRVPYLIREMRWGTRSADVTLTDDLFGMSPGAGYPPVAKDAGEVALEYGFDRAALDLWAYNSQMRYQAALKQGKFNEEIIPFEFVQKKKTVVFDKDEFPRADTTLEGLAKLPTIYGSPTITAGNSPGLDTGASAIVFMSRSSADAYGIKPLARILTVQSVAATPREMATVPALAIQKALGKCGLSVDDLNLIEINEAFAAVPMVSCKLLAARDEQKTKALFEITNVNGSAVAIGHPVGASGARILLTLVHELRRRGGGIGAAAICGGLSQGDAAIIEVE
jgi:acetyl-CoA C-acetyltransferase